METKFTKMQMWNFIPYATRMELVKKHEIKASAPREVANNVLVKDGITEADLELVPIEVLHEVTGIPAVKEEKKRAKAKKVTETKDEKQPIKKDEAKSPKPSVKTSI